MYIGVDATCWWNRRGFGRFTRELLSAMIASPGEHHYCLFVDCPPEPGMQRPQVRVIQVPTTRRVTEAAVANGRRSLRDMWRFSRAVMSEPVDVMFFPAVYSWFPIFGRLPTVITLHDAIAEHFPRLIFPNARGRLFWSVKMRAACWLADRILTVSHTAKKEIVDHLGVNGAMIDVICEGANAQFRPVTDPARCVAARIATGLPPDRRMILFVGGVSPHKNLANLMAGFALAAQQPGVGDVDLVIVGDPHGDGFHSTYGALKAQVETDGRLHNRVWFTGFVADTDLAALYSDALATVLPAFSEGFGLPALESMACGTPVLTSKTGATPEVVGCAGLAFDPFDPADICRQLCRAATDGLLWAGLRQPALDRAQHYSWTKAAQLAIASLEACGGTP